MIIVLCINLYSTRILLDNLGIDDYGIYNVVCGFVSMFMFINTSLSNGIQRFYNYEIGKRGNEGLTIVYSAALLIQILVIIIVILLTETVGLWYLNNKMVIPPDRILTAKYIYQLSILSFILVILQSPYSAAVLAFEKMDYYAIVSIIITIMKLLATISLPYWGYDRLLSYGLLLLSISFLEYILYFTYVKIKYKALKWIRLNDYTIVKSMWFFSGWNILGTFSSIMKEQGVNLILNFFCGPIVNAARGIAVQVNGGLQSFVSSLTIPVRPQVIQSYAAGDYNRTLSLTFTISKLSCFFLYMLALPVIAELDFLLHLWLGNDIPEYTSSFVVIIILTSFFSNLNAAVSGIVHASGQMKLYQLTTSLIGLLSIPLAYLMLKLYHNPNLALLMVLFVMMIIQIVSLMILKRIVKYSILSYFKEVIVPIVVVIISTAYIPFIWIRLIESSWLRLGLVFITSIIMISISIYLWGINKYEKLVLKQWVATRIRINR